MENLSDIELDALLKIADSVTAQTSREDLARIALALLEALQKQSAD